jgi:hypothetical protein
MAWNRAPQQVGRIPLMKLEVSKITYDSYNIKMGVLVKIYFFENYKLGFSMVGTVFSTYKIICGA